jgi:ribosomal protein L37AE/L43A
MMTSKNYSHYLNSRHWKTIAGDVKSKYHYECQICQNRIIDAVLDMLWDSTNCYWQIPELCRFVYTVIEGEGDPQRLAAHHLTYERVGHERDVDLACVCLACHILLTENSAKFGMKKSWYISSKYVAQILNKMTTLDKTKNEKRKSYDWLLEKPRE